MGQGGQSLADRPEAIQPQRVHGKTPERGQDLQAVGLALAVRVLPELGVAGPMPGVLDRPPISYVLPQGFGCGAQTRVAPRGALSEDVVTGVRRRLDRAS
jgi:hypothetical protein